jgi:hypothetical protein
MKRIKIMGLALVAVFAFSAMAVASASATPVVQHLFQLCVKAKKVGKVYSGNYTGSKCTQATFVATNGKYTLVSAVGDKTTSKSATSTLYSYIPASETEPWTGGTVVGTVVCKKSAGTGTITSNALLLSVINFETCTSEGKKCTSPGNTKGDIKTFPLSAELKLSDTESGPLLVSVATPQSGLAENPNNYDAEFNCEGLEVKTSGSSIGMLTGNEGSASKTSTDTLTVNPATGEPGISFYLAGAEGEEGKQELALLVSKITPPGINLPGGENTTQDLKGGNIGIYTEAEINKKA